MKEKTLRAIKCKLGFHSWRSSVRKIGYSDIHGISVIKSCNCCGAEKRIFKKDKN